MIVSSCKSSKGFKGQMFSFLYRHEDVSLQITQKNERQTEFCFLACVCLCVCWGGGGSRSIITASLPVCPEEYQKARDIFLVHDAVLPISKLHGSISVFMPMQYVFTCLNKQHHQVTCDCTMLCRNIL
jgi:hypothetical protein